MLKCSKCGNDAPYAEAPTSGSFICYECKMIHAWINGTEKPMVVTPKASGARPVVIGEVVLRYESHTAWLDKRFEQRTVNAVYSDYFSACADGGQFTNASPRYKDHCIKGKYPYWTHQDGSDITPP